MSYPKLDEIVEMNCDVPDKWIPDYWKESFYRLMKGSTVRIEMGEIIYYKLDFLSWYYLNKKEINRWSKINEIENE
jgi:hypothetical protein